MYVPIPVSLRKLVSRQQARLHTCQLEEVGVLTAGTFPHLVSLRKVVSWQQVRPLPLKERGVLRRDVTGVWRLGRGSDAIHSNLFSPIRYAYIPLHTHTYQLQFPFTAIHTCIPSALEHAHAHVHMVTNLYPSHSLSLASTTFHTLASAKSLYTLYRRVAVVGVIIIPCERAVLSRVAMDTGLMIGECPLSISYST